MVALGDHLNVHGRPRTTCRLCGECDIGCNYGSKNSLDYNYLSEAKRLGADTVKLVVFVGVMAALGVQAQATEPAAADLFEREHPGVPVYTAALDRELNENAFILPGLGDAGDRLYGTK